MRPLNINLSEYAKANNLDYLLDEYSKDNKLSPDEIGYDSTQEVAWTCSYGHTVIESPHKRVRRGYCPICGKARKGSFAQRYPELLKFWSYSNNINPEQLPSSYTGLIDWECEKGHKWSRRITMQVKLGNCPVCEQNSNNLFEVHPELLDHWDYDNNDVEPTTVLPYSNKEYSWICSNGHTFKATPTSIMRYGIKCPICSSAGFNNPDILNEWHPEKNGKKTAYDFSANSQKQAWFICSSCGAEYTSRIAARVKRKNNKCPNCR